MEMCDEVVLISSITVVNIYVYKPFNKQTVLRMCLP